MDWKIMEIGFLLEVMIFEIVIMGLNSTLYEHYDDVKIMNFGEELVRVWLWKLMRKMVNFDDDDIDLMVVGLF